MQGAFVVWFLLIVYIATRVVDVLNRLLSPDLVAVAFSEGGDDAYYFFVVARNFAEGKGFTVDGTHWTTGFQPLWQLLTGIAFLAGSDRGAFAVIYLMSFASWLAGAVLFVRFVRGASSTPSTPLVSALIAALFLCESQLATLYFNGLETGLYLTLCLGLLLAFQHHLQSTEAASLRCLTGVGLLAGLVMLTRNDGVFVCAGLLLATLLPGVRLRPVREAIVIVGIASAMLVPWLIYCFAVWGHPVPQTGVATSFAIRGQIDLARVLVKVLISVVPDYFLKVNTVIISAPGLALLGGIVAVAALLVWWRLRDRHAAIERSSRIVLAAFAVSCLLLLTYYVLVSSAIQFYGRYFGPLKLLVILLLALLLVHAIARVRLPGMVAAIIVGTVVTVGSHLYWIWRDYNLPFRGHMGDAVYAFVVSPYGSGNSRIGMFESGRIGFIYPGRIVNLDGKMRVDALKALRTRTMDRFLKDADLDYIILEGKADVAFLTALWPAWRDTYVKVGDLVGLHVFANTSKSP
jgi:hypothetical protein